MRSASPGANPLRKRIARHQDGTTISARLRATSSSVRRANSAGSIGRSLSHIRLCWNESMNVATRP